MSDEKTKKSVPWYIKAKQQENKKETDKVFDKFMSSHWYLVGLRGFKSIIGSKRAWCGLGAACSLFWAGMQVPKDGAGAKNWDHYGIALDWKNNGIPQGAFLRLNHEGNCKSSANNHITQADGDCTAADLLKPGATINGYGANQGNAWKVSTYSVKEICSVLWPADYEKPTKVLKSVNCSGKKSNQESTR